MWEEYKRLCRTTIDSGAAAASSGLDQGYCFVDQFFYKIEVLSFYPLVVRVYQLVSPVEADLIRVAAAPHLHQPKTVSAKSGVIKSKSATRSGKVAFLNQELEVLNYTFAECDCVPNMFEGLRSITPDFSYFHPKSQFQFSHSHSTQV